AQHSHSSPTRRSSDLETVACDALDPIAADGAFRYAARDGQSESCSRFPMRRRDFGAQGLATDAAADAAQAGEVGGCAQTGRARRSEEHTSELQSRENL